MSDNYLEHEFHTTYDKDCSTCYSESQVMQPLSEPFSFEEMLRKTAIINKLIYKQNG